MANAKQPSFSLETLRQIIATPEARALFKDLMKEEKQQDRTADMDALCIKAFKRAGFKAEDIKPRENVLTYNRWLQENRRVKQGEKSVPVKGLRLFHISQTDAITEAEKQEYLAQKAAKTSDELPVSPVVTPITAAKPKGKPAPQLQA
jgi:hypothetical protein